MKVQLVPNWLEVNSQLRFIANLVLPPISANLKSERLPLTHGYATEREACKSNKPNNAVRLTPFKAKLAGLERPSDTAVDPSQSAEGYAKGELVPLK